MKKMFTQVVIMVTALIFVVSVFMTPVSVRAQLLLPDVAENESSDTVDTTFGIPQINNTDSSSQQNTIQQNNAQQNTPQMQGVSSSAPSVNPLPECGITGGDSGSIDGCIVRALYYGVLYPSAILAGLGGSVFDWLAAYTLNSSSYSGSIQIFIEQGWRIVRDIANLSFIFVLLYIAFRYVLGLEGRDVQKTLIKIIGVALILNFSLFATRVIVDAGNILGRVFYENIIITNDAQAEQTGAKSISVGLVSLVNPQKLLTLEMFNSYAASNPVNQIGGSNLIGENVNDMEPSNGFIILVLIVASGINLLLAYVFFSVGIFLIARTIGLWIQMIFSPIAFLSIGIPKVGSMGGGRFDFSKWLTTTFSLSFLVVIFLFFLYLTVMFLQVSFETLGATFLGSGDNPSVLQIMMSVVVPFAIVYFLLITAKKQAKTMSGEFGEAAVKGLKAAVIGTLGAAGLAAGGAALLGGVAGRQVIGRMGAKMANKNATTAWGRAQKRVGKYLAKSSFDARNIKIPKPVTSALRSGLSYATGNEIAPNDFRLRLAGKGTTKGGLETRRQKYVEDKVKDAENLVQNEDTKLKKGHYYDKDTQGNIVKVEIDLNMSVNEARRQFERKRFEIMNDPAHQYEEKKINLENKEKAYKEAERQLQNGTGNQAAVAAAKADFDQAKQDLKAVESKWKQEEDKYKAAQNSLGQAQAEHYRDYARSTGTFDPRNRAVTASEVVEDKAYAQDKKNEAKAKKDKNET